MPKTYEEAVKEKKTAARKYEEEIRKYWLVSKDVRMRLDLPEALHRTIKTFLGMKSNSEWFRSKLLELQDINEVYRSKKP